MLTFFSPQYYGNVGVNVVLAMLMVCVLPGSGLIAFCASTVGITFLGELLPQAYFSRNAIRIGAKLAPIIRSYQIMLLPVAKPNALILEGLVGAEGVNFMRKKILKSSLKDILKKKILKLAKLKEGVP